MKLDTKIEQNQESKLPTIRNAKSQLHNIGMSFSKEIYGDNLPLIEKIAKRNMNPARKKLRKKLKISMFNR